MSALEYRLSEIRAALRSSHTLRMAARKLGINERALQYFCHEFELATPQQNQYFRPNFQRLRPIAGYDELPRMFPLPPPQTPPRKHKGISSLKPLPPDRPMCVEDIREAVCTRFGITRSELMGTAKPFRISHPRQLAMLLTRELTNYSLPRIGRLFNRKDHTTVLHGINAASERVKEDAEWAQHYAVLKQHLTAPPANDVGAAT